MSLYVSIVGTYNPSLPQPTRSALLSALRRHSARSYYATRSYLWTADSLFAALSPKPSPSPDHYAFAACLRCGGNDDDVRVTLMILLDLTIAVAGLAVVAVESFSDAPNGHCGCSNSLFDKNEDNNNNMNHKEATCGDVNGDEEGLCDALLVELADAVEGSEARRAAFLTRWNLREDNYHDALIGRLVLFGGALHVVPAPPSRRLPIGTLPDGPVALLTMGPARRATCRETLLTDALHLWANGVADRMRSASSHWAVAAVPAAVAQLLAAHPNLAGVALLHHGVCSPMREPPHSSGNCAGGVAGWVMEEFQTLLRNGREVRMPLCLPRFLFAHAHCMAPLQETITALLRASHIPGDDYHTREDVRVDETEVALGFQLTVGLQRLRSETTGTHCAAVNEFLKSQTERYTNENPSDVTFLASGGVDSGKSSAWLKRLRRRVMPVPSMRSASAEWMAEYAREAAAANELTAAEFGGFDVAMREGDEESVESSSSSADVVKDDLENSSESDSEGAAISALSQAEEMNSLIEAHVQAEVLRTCNGSETAFHEVASNTIFREAVKLIAREGMHTGE